MAYAGSESMTYVTHLQAMCGTELAYGATSLCGTELAYGATSLCGTELAYGSRSPEPSREDLAFLSLRLHPERSLLPFMPALLPFMPALLQFKPSPFMPALPLFLLASLPLTEPMLPFLLYWRQF
eukprot:3446208-Rhodomonas_salina.2